MSDDGKSSFPAAIEQFKMMISGLPELVDVQIIDGFPGPEIEMQSVVVAPSASIVDDWQSLGCRRRSEQWSAKVYVTVARPDDSVVEARARVFEIVDAIATALKRDAVAVELNRTVLWSSFHRTQYVTFVGENGGAGAQIECDLAGRSNY
jgi:hypothetical protein